MNGVGRFRADIQGLRAIAVLVVVAFHADLALPGGFLGVDVFFAISGFVITGMLVAEQERTGRLALGRFYLRRIRRLLPALAAMVAVVLVLLPLLGPRSAAEATTRTAVAGSLFSANVQLLASAQGYFDPRTEANAFLHLWTLSVEEQFYLVFPLLLLGATRLGARRAVLGSAALVSSGLAVALAGGHVPGVETAGPRVAFYSAPTRAWEFLAGCLLALVVARGWSPSRAVADGCGAVGAVLLVGAVVAFDEATAFPWPVGVVPVLAAMLLLAAGSGDGGRVSAALAVAPARWLGDRSYGWYLWHWPFVVFARSLVPGQGWAPPAAALVALAPTVLSHRFLEQPIRTRAPRPRPTLALGAACLAVPVVLAATVAPQGAALDRNPTIRAMNAQMGRHLDLTRGCVDNGAVPMGPERCTWAAPTPTDPTSTDPTGSTGRAVLLGDSNAGHLSEGFVDASASLGLEAAIATRTGCPFADVELRRDGQVDDGCRAFYRDQLAALARDRPTAVVLASATDLRVVEDASALRPPGDGPWATDPDGKLTVWSDGLARTVARLEELGIGVVVVTPVPRFTGWQPLGECARLRILLDVSGCGTERATVDTAPMGPRFREAELEAVAGRDRAIVLDLGPALCPGPTCRTDVDGTWVFRDESHITVGTSHQVAPLLAEALRSVTG
ncbi:MAG TPA: acyltransferase family protein [Acidimicrobiales bacterium]|jgi:peptidoglycan/LPS O-acetylase OafA/YrhL|nr:acyltransferase [Acidimicrobiales bacterium]HRA33664.1 acyltransferase family protein [Acidimicrobiales bacterium]